jgi:hypothetical protein
MQVGQQSIKTNLMTVNGAAVAIMEAVVLTVLEIETETTLIKVKDKLQMHLQMRPQDYLLIQGQTQINITARITTK